MEEMINERPIKAQAFQGVVFPDGKRKYTVDTKYATFDEICILLGLAKLARVSEKPHIF
jgi:hypothetical protein